MNIREVTEHIINSFHKITPYQTSGTSPRIINLLDKTKKDKTQAVEQAFFDYMKGEDIVVLLSVSISSKLFRFILKCVPSVWFIEGRVSIDQNKRKDVVALMFTHKPLSI